MYMNMNEIFNLHNTFHCYCTCISIKLNCAYFCVIQEGQTALHLSCCPEVIATLIISGAKPNLQDKVRKYASLHNLKCLNLLMPGLWTMHNTMILKCFIAQHMFKGCMS